MVGEKEKGKINMTHSRDIKRGLEMEQESYNDFEGVRAGCSYYNIKIVNQQLWYHNP